MKTILLSFLLTTINLVLPAQDTSQVLEAKIVDVFPDPAKYEASEFRIKVKITNRLKDSILPGEIIYLNSIDDKKPYWISTQTIKRTLLRDSSLIFEINGVYLEGVFAERIIINSTTASRERVTLTKCKDLGIGKHSDSIRKCRYDAIIALTPPFPPAPAESGHTDLELDYWQSLGQLSVKFKSSKPGRTQWKLTDNMGRTISRGYFDVVSGDNSFSLMVENLSGGRYTMSVGDTGDAVNENFTVVGR
jgi:hypothetical protein